MIEWLDTIDQHIFLWLNNFHSPFWDKIMWFISGKEEWIPLYLIILFFLVYKYKWRSLYILAGAAFVILLADRISVEVFKEVVKRPRPTHNLEINHLIHTVDNYFGGQYGFVSSHAANSFGLAVYLSYVFQKKWVTWSFIFWALLISYSRIYLGVHYPGDILGGALLGAACGTLSYFLLQYLNYRFKFGIELNHIQ